MMLVWLFTLLVHFAVARQCPSLSTLQQQLQYRLSNGSSIVGGTSGPERWSVYREPQPSVVVNVASEMDVATAVTYCNQNNMTFVAQNGGNGWADTFDLGSCGMIINIAGLNWIGFNGNATQANVGGGVRVQAMIDAAYARNARFANPTCECLGFLGTGLGGGLTRMTGLYGWVVDQFESFNVVLASGELVHVNSQSDPDLFWALAGAAANFGIVTSTVLKSYPIPREENIVWQGPVTFSEDKLGELIDIINNLELEPHMAIDVLLSTSGPPSYTPGITIWPFFLGNATSAEKAFAPILALGPTTNNATVMSYANSSDWSISFCETGGRKPAYGASGTNLNSTDFVAVYQSFKNFIATYGAETVGFTSILVEHYTTVKAMEIGSATSSYPWRNLSYHTAIIPWYQNASFDETANAWGEEIRALLRKDDGIADNSTYINFAHGDETREDIYGDSLPRLLTLKAKYDPMNRFNQWFPLMN